MYTIGANLVASNPSWEGIMRRLFLILTFASILVTGGVVATAQSGTQTQTEQEDTGAQGAGCITPVAASPEASPGLALPATPGASPGESPSASPIASPGASPVALEACGTPLAVGTPST